MHPHIDVRFYDRVRDASLASTVHRWIARFETMNLEVARAAVEIQAEHAHTSVVLRLSLVDGSSSTATTSHLDPYVAVSDAFRAARRELLEQR